MKVSYNWLKEFVTIPAEIKAAEVAARLTMSTVEVEEIIDQAEALENMVVGEIRNIVKHPQADKLQVCEVDIGNNKIIQVICGANNISVGFKGVVALPGSRVRWHGQGDWVTLEATKIRGVESFGMICAANEIGLSAAEETGVLELPNTVKVGQSAAEVLSLNDQVIDIDNKSINHRPDLWGHLGMAREVGAIFGYNFSLPKVSSLKELSKNISGGKNDLKVKVENENDCSRYVGVLIKNIVVEESPDWLKRKLMAVGSRPINLLVDLTNYVMLEIGEPLHAFDAGKLADKNIIVRRAKKGEDLVCLDGNNYKLDESILVIADKEKPLALAGIMGGVDSAISNETKEVVLEAATFDPVLIRKAAMSLNNRTDASSRFEKSLDSNLPELAASRFLNLLKDIQPQIEISALVDFFPKPPKQLVVDLSVDFAKQRIGQDIPTEKIKTILESLSFVVKEKKKGFWQVSVPSFRATKDIKEPIDLIEEIARIYGYDNLTPTLPHVDLVLSEFNIFKTAERQTKNWLSLAGGLSEVYNYAFTGEQDLTNLGFDHKEAIGVKNPVAPELNLMRPSLIPSLVNNLKANLRWQDNLSLFELDRVFLEGAGEFSVDQNKKDFLPKQPYHLGLSWLLKKEDQQQFFVYKGVIEGLLNNLQVSFTWELAKDAPSWVDAGTCLAISNEQGVFGYFGWLKPEYQSLLVLGKKDQFTAILAEIDFQLLVKGISQTKRHQSLSKFPPVLEDLAVVVNEEIIWSEVEKIIKKVDSLILQASLFDVYHLDGGQKSLAFRLTLQSQEKTLTSEEIKQVKEKVLAELKHKFNATLR